MRKLIVKAIRIQLVHAVIQRKAKNQSIKLTFNSEKNKIKNSRKSKEKTSFWGGKAEFVGELGPAECAEPL